MSTDTTLEPDAAWRDQGPGGTTSADRAAVRVRFEAFDGRRVVVKQARGAGRVALRRESAVLRSIAGPDLVRHVELREDDDLTELVLLDAGAPSLAAVMNDPATSPAGSLHLLADACEAVARLHARGWAHGRISQDHILTTRRGRIRLCSLSHAEPIDVDPAAATHDRVALLRTVDLWTQTRPTGHGRLRSARRRMVARRVRRRTHRLVDDPDPLVLARILRRAAGLKRSTRPSTARASGRSSRPRVLIVLAATVAAAVLAFGALRSWPPSQPAERSATPPAPSPATAPLSATTVVAEPAETCADVDARRPDTDGDGCGDLVSVDGEIVAVNGMRYRVGAPGDVIAVGDWDCDGTATVLALRPSTGEIHHFPTWADPGAPATGQLIDIVPGARDLRPSDALCGRARLRLTDGSEVTTGAAP